MRSDAENAFGAPRLDQIGELVMENSSATMLPIGELLVTTATAAIFAVRDDATRVVKYFHNCFDLELVHPLLRGYVFLKSLEGLHVTPRVHYLSPPVRFPPWITSKPSCRINSAARAECAAHPGVQIRFMVMDRVWTSLDNRVLSRYWVGRRSLVNESIQMVASLIEAIERIHDQGVVHGDIHWGNVVLVKRGEQQSIALIDFGNAMFVDEMVALPEMARAPRSLNHCLLSHWNIEGFRFSYRDDVYKALLLLAFLINGSPFEHFCLSLEANVEDMLWFKREAFLSAMPTGHEDRITGLSVHRDIKQKLRVRLNNALQMARNVEALDDRPNYSFIVTELQGAARLVSPVHF